MADIEVWRVLVAMAASLFAGLIGGLSGMGGGLIVATAAAPIFGVKAVIPLMSIYTIVNNISRVSFFWSDLNWRIVATVLLGSTPAIAVGVLLFKKIDSSVIELILGFTILASILVQRTGLKPGLALRGKGLVGAGAVTGFLGTLTVGMGTLIMPVLLGAGLRGTELLGTRSGVGLGLGLLKISAFSATGLMEPELILAGVLMGLCGMPGLAFAVWLVRRTDIHMHTILMEIILAICAGLLIRDAAKELLASL